MHLYVRSYVSNVLMIDLVHRYVLPSCYPIVTQNYEGYSVLV